MFAQLSRYRGTAVRFIKKVGYKVDAKWVGALAFALALLAAPARAADAFTMPEMPIDFKEIATAGLATIGLVVVAVAGVVIVVRLIKVGLSWITRAFSGNA